MTLYLATGNAHKIGEVSAILAAAHINAQVLPPSAVGGMPQVEEDTGTFEGNARKKALALAVKIPADAWALADDSGVCVDALGGAPGVESAYYAGHPSNDAANNAKLLAALRDVAPGQRTASFFCCIVAAAGDGRTNAFEGRCPGRVLAAPRGVGGFGYDPVFQPDGCTESYAELASDVKNRISHRARALAEFIVWLRGAARG